MAGERIRATLSSMGLRAEASLAKHLLQKNSWESNLVSDISKVNYLEGHQGRTNLQPLEGLPLFVDDIYVHGFLDRTETIHVRGNKISCEPTAKQIVARISMAAQEALGGPRKNTNISHTVLSSTKRLKNPRDNHKNRERNRAAIKKAVETAVPGKGGVRSFCCEDRCVGGRDRKAARASANTGQTLGKPRR